MAVEGMQQTHAIVLAGVHLWEESAFDNATPRPLLPIGQQPLICHVLRWLQRGGVSQATICANSTSRFVRKCLGTGTSLRMYLDYYEDWTPRGPAGCARDAAQAAAADRYVVVDGTILPQTDLGALLERHAETKADVTVAVSTEPSPLEAQPGRFSPVGIYVFERQALECVGAIGYQDIKEVLIPRLHADGRRIATHLAEGPCPRVNGLGSYLAVNEWHLEHLPAQSDGLSEYRRVGEAWVHRTAWVDPSAKLIGPVLLGAGSRVAKGAVVVGPCVIGAECLLAAGAIVCRSVVWDHCRIGRSAVVDHCVLTHQASVRGGEHLYEKVHLPAGGLGLLDRMRAWTHPWTMPADRPAAQVLKPAALGNRRRGRAARAADRRSVGELV